MRPRLDDDLEKPVRMAAAKENKTPVRWLNDLLRRLLNVNEKGAE